MRTLKLLLPALLLCAVMLLQAEEAWASRQITLQNSSSRKINVALVLPSNRGWWVTAWYSIAPWSTRRVNINWAGGNQFGYYAYVPGQQIYWSGKGYAPNVYLSTAAQSHAANQRVGGKAYKVVMKNGNAVKFTWAGDRAGGGNKPSSSGWW
ncbi:MAG: hypothetical protein LBN33_05670 [Desulfovibrio sp.]|jgi:hypothetical protein|nr:hypothetical protein [Desulfovibrio sp.]